ncbi:MAG: (Fe-S)-binding protein [bacterium]|nr:(Fe-S)-binding protein [bacterium]
MIKGYSDLVLESRGCDPGSMGFKARFKFNTDISSLFPYINAVAEKPLYFDKPHYIKFTFNEFHYALYPDNGFLALVENRAHAIEAIEKLIEFLNDIYSRKDSIKPDHKKFKHIPALDIYKLLSKSNCKKCGFQTCMSFAAALGKGEASLDKCPDLCNLKGENVIKLRSMLFE